MIAGPRLRLSLLAAAMTALLVLFWIGRPLSPEGVRDAIEPFGAWAPVVFVPVAAALGVALVSGALLAGAAGLLFGTATGFAVTLCASVLSALGGRAVAHRAAHRAFTETAGPRSARTAAAVRRHGVWSVVFQRLLPAVPDGPANYAFGVAGVGAGAIAAGTLIGAAPRAFAYVALGDSLDDLGSTQALVAFGVIAATGLAGMALAARAAAAARS